MARTKNVVDLDELQQAFIDLESTKVFSSPHKLYEATAATDWAKSKGITAVMIYLRVKEANADPQNPKIMMRVQPARKMGQRTVVANGDGASETTPDAAERRRAAATRQGRVKVAEIPDIQVLIDAFTKRGVTITGVESFLTSARKTKETNRAILLAWCDLRDALGHPKPATKTSMVDVPVHAAVAVPVPQAAVPAEVQAETVNEVTAPVQDEVFDAPVAPVQDPVFDAPVAPVQDAVEAAPVEGEPSDAIEGNTLEGWSDVIAGQSYDEPSEDDDTDLSEELEDEFSGDTEAEPTDVPSAVATAPVTGKLMKCCACEYETHVVSEADQHERDNDEHFVDVVA